jgi:hypothetical protein
VNQGFSSKLKGKWHGSVSDELGGYIQEFDFLNHKDVMVFVMGHNYPGTFVVDAGQSPVHIDIQVIPPDAPPGYAPPPVPHIVRFSGPGSLELCCPYMSQARPANFEGPGYCVLKQGGMAAGGDDESLKGLSADEKRLQCAKATLEMMPNTAMEQPSQFDTEEVAATKMLAQVKFQSTIYKLESKYGEDTFRQVMTDASEPMSSEGAYGDAIRKLREKIIETKLIPTMDEERAAAESAAQAKAREESAAVGSSRPTSLGPKAETKEKDAPVSASSESTEAPAVPPLDAVAPYLLGTVVVLGAAALVFSWMRRHKS